MHPQHLWLVLVNVHSIWALRFLNATNDNFIQCPEFYSIEHGIIEYRAAGSKQIATVTCQDGYDLDGPKETECIEGLWKDTKRPSCVKRCTPPPFLKNGALEIDGQKDSNGFYQKNSLATYTCSDGYTLVPPESHYRVCEKGIWTGKVAKCMIDNCPRPKDILNGYYIEEASDIERGNFFIGQRIHYKCKSGYTVVDYSVLECMEGGFWEPKQAPRCELNTADAENKAPCRSLPQADNANTVVLNSIDQEPWLHGTQVGMLCIGRYRDLISPCEPTRLQCNDGKWEGILPKCEMVTECYAPPNVRDASIISLDISNGESAGAKYPIKSQVTYQCFDNNYDLQGDGVLTCSLGGCWEPKRAPECLLPRYDCGKFPLCVDKATDIIETYSNALLWSMITGVGVMTVLWVLCCLILSHTKKPPARTVANSTTVIRSTTMNDHATLLNNPDRLALIAFADGVQNLNEDALPSYDEAVRRASSSTLHGGLLSTGSRLARPQWPNLAGRRVRTSPNPDLVSVTRHGSFASHSPSTRSGVDSMGSTDTVAISEGSTNVTLDTASSHSGSQPGSCRVHCGSLASFDMQSGMNTEDAPLLEESELEEVHVNGLAIGDNFPASDNSSFKSADIP